MIRVYLDWNIFSYLKRLGDVEEPYKSLKKILNSYSDILLIPYSFAHLNDLSVSYKQGGKGKEMSMIDIENIKLITKDNALIFDYKKGTTEASVYDVKDYFFYLIENNIERPTTLTGLFDDDIYDVGEDIEFKDFLKKIREPIFNAGFEEIPEKFGFLEKYFESFIENSNFENLFNGFLTVFDALAHDDKLYTGLRNSVLNEYNLNHDYKNSIDVFFDLNRRLLKSPYKKTFEELQELISANTGDGETKSYQRVFSEHFIALDYLGFYCDKKINNLIQDSYHSFFGAHCDFFVTDDNNTYEKSKLLYKHFNIETKVCKSSEFITKFYQKAYLKGGIKLNLLETVNNEITQGFVISRSWDDEFNPVDIYKFDIYLVNYFNRMQITHFLNKTIITLYKNPKNYSKAYFLTEISSIVNGVVDQLGSDHFRRGKYHPESENQSLDDMKWEGRLWVIGNKIISLEMLDYPFGMALKIRLPKN